MMTINYLIQIIFSMIINQLQFNKKLTFNYLTWVWIPLSIFFILGNIPVKAQYQVIQTGVCTGKDTGFCDIGYKCFKTNESILINLKANLSIGTLRFRTRLYRPDGTFSDSAIFPDTTGPACNPGFWAWAWGWVTPFNQLGTWRVEFLFNHNNSGFKSVESREINVVNVNSKCFDIEEALITPSNPTDRDEVNITLKDFSTQQCYTLTPETKTITRNGNQLNLKMDFKPINTVCPALITDNTVPFKISNLPVGEYCLYYRGTGFDNKTTNRTCFKVKDFCDINISKLVSFGTCGNTSNGKISLNWTGGKSPYRINYTGVMEGNVSSVTNTRTLTGLKIGHYNIVITDANDCTTFTSTVVEADNSCRCADSLQLVTLYNVMNGANWTRKWILTESMETWQGVKLNTEGCVAELYLVDNSLYGTFPNLSLTKLTRLDIGYNNIFGSLPDFNLPELTFLSAWTCGFSGTIPNFSNMSKLKQLNLGVNKFQGNLPLWTNLPNIQEIDVGYNNGLTGVIPAFSFPNLIFFSGFDCDFTGLTNFSGCPNLKKLPLDRNNFSGTIPNFSLPNLIELGLDRNNFTGTIPDFNMPKLQLLVLSNNELSGQLPDFLNLNNLIDIQVQNNQLTGCFPFSYYRFCLIPNSFNRNFSGNTGLPNNGNFPIFCTTPLKLDSTTQNTTIFRGDSFTLPSRKVVVPLTTTTYRDTVLTGCNGRMYITNLTVKQKDTTTTSIKTIITPNGDGKNDKLDLPMFDWQKYPASNIIIVNSLGQTAYTAMPYNQDWQGQSNEGKDLSNGEYFFILNLKPNGRTITGSIHLAR